MPKMVNKKGENRGEEREERTEKGSSKVIFYVVR